MKFPNMIKAGLNILSKNIWFRVNSFSNGVLTVKRNEYLFLNIESLKEAVEKFDGSDEQSLLDACIEARIDYVPSSVKFSEDVYLKGLKIKNNKLLEFNEELLLYGQDTYIVNSLKTDVKNMPPDVKKVFESLRTVKVIQDKAELKLYITYSPRCLSILEDLRLELKTEILETKAHIRYFNDEVSKKDRLEIWYDFEGTLNQFVENVNWTKCVVHRIEGDLC